MVIKMCNSKSSESSKSETFGLNVGIDVKYESLSLQINDQFQIKKHCIYN